MVEEFRVPIGIPVDTNAKDAASSVSALSDQIARSKGAIADSLAVWRGLKTNTDAAKAAKDQLKVAIEGEKAAITDATLKLLAQGTSYEKVTAAAKESAKQDQAKTAAMAAEKAKADELAAAQTKLADKAKAADAELKKKTIEQAKDRTKSFHAAVTAAGGPIAMLRDKWKALKEVLGQNGGGVGLATLAVAGLGAAVAALVAGVGLAYVSLGKFILSGANAARSAGLLREAVTGSAEDAGRLGTQVDALASKVPTAKDELNKLAVSLRKSGLSGQTLVDTFNAVGQASAALGEDTGSKLKDILERGKLSGRVAINPMELVGSGFKFDEIAQALATSMNVGVDKARAALFEGRVRIGDAAAAIRMAVEKKVGGINLRKMLDFDVLIAKTKELLGGLTSKVNLEPLGRAFGKLLPLLGPTTKTGQQLQHIVTLIGDGIVNAIARSAPLAKTFVQSLVLGGLRAENGWLKLQIAVLEAFGPNVVGQLKLGEAATWAVARAGDGLAVFGVAAERVGKFVTAFGDIIHAADKVRNTDWAKVGGDIIDGIATGLTSGVDRLEKAVEDVAARVKGGFKDALGIHSPSKVFAGYGQDTAEGYAQGVEAGGPRASGAVADMVPPPASAASPASAVRSGGGAAGAGVGPITVNVAINVKSSGGDAVAKDLSSPSFLAQLTKTIEDALTGAGIPVQA